MNPRDMIAPEALAIIDAVAEYDVRLLSPRAEATLRAVEKRIEACPWHPVTERGVCVDCLDNAICRAWMGKDAPKPDKPPERPCKPIIPNKGSAAPRGYMIFSGASLASLPGNYRGIIRQRVEHPEPPPERTCGSCFWFPTLEAPGDDATCATKKVYPTTPACACWTPREGQGGER